MASPRLKPATKIGIEYAALALVCVAFWLYVTFPYDALKNRIVSEAAAAGLNVSIESAGPGLFGVSLHNVRIQKSADSTAAPPLPGEAFTLRSVTVRPSLIPIGLAFHANVLGGSASGAVGGLGDLAVRMSFEDLDPSKGNLKALSGLEMSGKLKGELSLTLPKDELSHEYDLSRAKGSLTLNTDRLMLQGGTVVVPMYGQPMPFSLQPLAIGNFHGHVAIDKGLATLDDVRSQSDDLELLASGTVKLNRRPEYSDLNLEVKLKPDPQAVKRWGLIGAGLSMLPNDRQNPGFRLARINGYLGQPNFITAR